jgi:hypothetical protein
VEVSYNLGYIGIGKTFELAGTKYEASSEDYESTKTFYNFAIGLIADGRVRIHPKDVREGGLEGGLRGWRR